ncbi:hypothetical protein B0H14DRAFT_3428103 [Mycena olivaceomarginata]|nr:hypothetical protein B0H14DRAFT_3428103 [Mycena olivaceomarginata]
MSCGPALQALHCRTREMDTIILITVCLNLNRCVDGVFLVSAALLTFYIGLHPPPPGDDCASWPRTVVDTVLCAQPKESLDDVGLFLAVELVRW